MFSNDKKKLYGEIISNINIVDVRLIIGMFWKLLEWL